MRNSKLLGPFLFLAAGAALVLPKTLELRTGLHLPSAEAGYASLALAGLVMAARGWRSDLARASSHGLSALRRATSGSAGIRPAKRMKIRIRCAR
ncbi:hypothetical protein E0493_19520 [Roseomonas sp. M0104]|uniref:Uncharacterized protein n=1 Tax=Teichococcus coralli TaxID=2545983 RepID=A0A845BEJ9_9PROT|nr:hypothetical protein [Pseudoroseomonas coralli]MXP65541.1 hypothetical protein [Pseudoroseomonas coralli]